MPRYFHDIFALRTASSRRRAPHLSAAVALAFALSSAGCSSTAPLPVPEGPSVDVRVMSFNIRYANPDDGPNAWPERRARVTSLLSYYEADLLGLQEVLHEQLNDLREALPGYAFVGVGRTDGRRDGEYAPVAFRRSRFDLLDTGTIWLSETPSDTGSVGWDAALPRIATWAHLMDRRSGADLFVFNTHFDHRGETARKESARLLAQSVEDRAGVTPVVVTGDFNMRTDSDGYRRLTQIDRRPSIQNRYALIDARTAAGARTGPARTYSGFDFALPEGGPIDYIFVKNGVEIRFFATLIDHWDRRFPSDHRPVMADLAVPASNSEVTSPP